MLSTVLHTTYCGSLQSSGWNALAGWHVQIPPMQDEEEVEKAHRLQ
jgi:hypothetical protein